jgi:hypothetical protein
MFNISYRKVGGLSFIKIGRLSLSFSVAPEYRPIGSSAEARQAAKAARQARLQRKLGKAYEAGESFGLYLASRGVR